MNRQPAEWVSVKVRRETYELAARVAAAQQKELEGSGLTGSINAIVWQALRVYATDRYPGALSAPAKTS